VLTECIHGVLTENGKLFSCGEMDNGKLGFESDADIDHFSPQRVNILDRVISVSCGHNHTVAVTGLLLLVFTHNIVLLFIICVVPVTIVFHSCSLTAMHLTSNGMSHSFVF